MSTEKLRALRERLLASGIRVIDEPIVIPLEPMPPNYHGREWVELFDLQGQCEVAGSHLIFELRELGDEWAVACEGWSRS